MRYLLVILLSLFLVTLGYAKVYDFSDEASEQFLNQYHRVYIPSGAVIYSRLNSNIDSNQNTRNEEITTQMMRDWIYQGKIIAPEGSLIKGRITNIQNAAYASGNAKVYVTFNQVVRPDGSVINFTSKPICVTVGDSRAKSGAKSLAEGVLQNFRITSSASAMAENVITGAVVGGVAFLSTKGEEVNIPIGTEFRINIMTAVVTTDYEN